MVFNSDINFVVGINGSGKTTALKLIQAALTLNLPDLLAIGFRGMTIGVQDEARRVRLLSLDKSRERLRVRLEDEVGELEFPILVMEGEDYSKSDRMRDHLQELRFKSLHLNKNNVSAFLREINKPIFLGLDRRPGWTEEDLDADEYSVEMRRKVLRAGPRPFRASAAVDGLEVTRSLLQGAYRRFRQVSDRQNEKITNAIFRSTFKYSELDVNWLQQAGYADFQQIIKRRSEIQRDIAKILGDADDTSDQIGSFFTRLESSFNNMAREREGLNIEWLLNKARVTIIEDILREMDRNKQSADAAYRPIKKFLETVNFFFSDSKKVASVDEVGGLLVHHSQSQVPMQALSSGERQLLILIAHAIFIPRGADVIIIDEPELSLHLKWQEALVDKLVELNDKKQYIFATHSPEIIGVRKYKALGVTR